MTLECSGNSAFPFNKGLVSNASLGRVRHLPRLLEEAGIQEDGREVVFWGADAGEQVWRDVTITEQFARSMSIADAMNPNNLIAIRNERRAVAAAARFPGPIDCAGLVWRCQREVADPHRSARQPLSGAFHGPRLRHDPRGRDRRRNGLDLYLRGRDRLKSAPAKVTKTGDTYQNHGRCLGGADRRR